MSDVFGLLDSIAKKVTADARKELTDAVCAADPDRVKAAASAYDYSLTQDGVKPSERVKRIVSAMIGEP